MPERHRPGTLLFHLPHPVMSSTPRPSQRLSQRLSLLALSLLATAPAVAAPYATGDLLIGFVASAGTGVDETLVLNLGTSASFRDAFDSGTARPDFKTIGSQLTAQFGADWYDRTDLRVNIFGATSPDTVGDDLFNLDPFQTVYVSRSRVTPGANSAAQNVATNNAMTTASSRISLTSTVYAAATADAAGVAIIPDSAPNTLDEFTRPAVTASFGTFSSGIDQILAVGPWGTYPDVPVEAALDLFRIQGRNDVAGQYSPGTPTRQGTYKGTFTIKQNGAISFVTAPPATSGFSTWALGKGLPANLSTTDDRDLDRVPALVEYALNLNPVAFDTLPAPTAVAGGLQFSYTKNPAAAADPKITYQIEASSQLSSGWSPLTPTTNSTTQISALLPANDPSGRLFARLKITQTN
ncbi:MAG: hypothetical protein JWL81_3189 [Verrucomicrobiales bacterium]|nr:hypothetical protein [Verrucomicrobiales bacterium]